MPNNDMDTREQVTAGAIRRDYSAFYTPGAIVLAGIFVAIGLFFGLSHGGNSGAATGGNPPAKAVNIKDVKTAGEPFIGSDSAPVVLAFWSDYQCPFCKAFEVGGVPQINGANNSTTPPALPDLVKQYVNTGQLKIVFKDFAFLGQDSTTAAEYGRAVWDIYPTQYFAWRTAMYVAQDQEGDQGFGNAATIDQLIISKFPAMNDAKIKTQITNNKAKYDAAIAADMQEGESFGITGTPGFITGTQMIGGFAGLSTFTAVIDPQLK
ncbi:MAG TPA: thioredoxin domain-containing protein [Candidatus Paceibacterota bacterium]|nr:thioredoxin domain-containing protein [Candidatus Paceibacterota bacterium]